MAIFQARSTCLKQVRDTGAGISSDQIPFLFERFHRIEGVTARTLEGSGIGLALVRELVQLHGGHVGVESESRRGTMFTVTVPLGLGHLPAQRIVAPQGADYSNGLSAHYADEGLRCCPMAKPRPTGFS